MKDWKKHKGFKTPEGYFDSLTDRILEKVGKESQSAPENEGFSTPDNYFESFNDKLKARMEPKETKVVQLRSYRRYWVAAASIAAIFLLVVVIPWGGTEESSFDTLASAEIEAYLDEGDLGLSSYELAEFIAEDALQEDAIMEMNIEDENIMEYLDDTIDDIDELNLDYDEE
ncbi:MAG: hypothetical protein OER83_04355 [Flavobacteriaceae bacterium]|nr:hypothetical protein [Flavobacteriaceae bacterium]MDH3796086.1 hypothetical protein [Flavobacteriaceae bacterium]